MAAKPKPRRTDPDRSLRDHLVALLGEGHAHVPFKDAIADWPAELRGTKPPGQPFTPWRLLEHIRISQWDIVEFTKSAKHISPKWPAGYWPASDAPPDAGAWDKSVAQVKRDLQAMRRLVRDPATDLFARLPHGTGQTVLREAPVLADHNAYHLGQLVLIRRLLGAWKTKSRATRDAAGRRAGAGSHPGARRHPAAGCARSTSLPTKRTRRGGRDNRLL